MGTVSWQLCGSYFERKNNQRIYDWRSIYSCIKCFCLVCRHGWFCHPFRQTALSRCCKTDVTSALFKFLDYFPASTFISVLAIALVLIFFITSANSAVFVLGMVSENGNPNPSHVTKTIWGIIIAAIAIVRTMTGGLSGLQSALVAMAAPLSIMMLIMCYSTL